MAKNNRILDKILPFKFCPICTALEAESVIEPHRVLGSNAVLFSCKLFTKKLISVWCTCKNYHHFQVRELLRGTNSMPVAFSSFFFFKSFYSFLASCKWKYWKHFHSKTISSLHVTSPDMKLYSEMFMLWWYIPGYSWDSTMQTPWIPWNMFLNANAIVVILENKLIQRENDIWTQICQIYICVCEYHPHYKCKMLTINTHFFGYRSPADNFWIHFPIIKLHKNLPVTFYSDQPNNLIVIYVPEESTFPIPTWRILQLKAFGVVAK